MNRLPNLSLEQAPIPTPSADPVLIDRLLVAGLAEAHAIRLARCAAGRMRFMPADIRAAYLARLIEPHNESEAGLLSRVRQTLKDRAT